MEKQQNKQKDIHLPLNVFIKANETKLSLKKDQPDCLIKVLGKPMLFYVLEFLERNYIKEVTILTTSEFSYDVNSTIQENYQGLIKTTVLIASQDKLEGVGLFSFIERKLTEQNFLLMNANVLCEFDLVEMFNCHLLSHQHVSMCIGRSDEDSRPRLSPYAGEGEDDKKTMTHVFGMESFDLVDENGQNLKVDLKNKYKKLIYSCIHNSSTSHKISTDILSKHPEFQLESSFHDIEFYIIKRQFYDLLQINKIKSMESIKHELLPFLINKQDHRIIKSSLLGEMRFNANILTNNCYKLDNYNKLIGVLSEIQKPVKDVMIMFFPTRNNDENVFVEYKDFINNNIMNNKNPTYEIPGVLKSIGIDCYVAKPVEIDGVKVSVSKSCLGKGCRIGNGSKIMNSFVMDGCVIGKNCEISNCLLEKNVVLKDNTTLKNYIVMEGSEVDNN